MTRIGPETARSRSRLGPDISLYMRRAKACDVSISLADSFVLILDDKPLTLLAVDTSRYAILDVRRRHRTTAN
jgi:hypothetical protein